MTLLQARTSTGLSRSELARLAGVSDDDIYDIEKRRNRNPSWALVGRLTRALREAGLPVTEGDLFPLRKGAA